ncbi:hypothetical protein N0B31_02720 [Salinirubellus salinus]|uniref:Uncharacterized protein n=1 Tax=Salinirubellus salinus TaxID=1364945 RepID=A0A9E7UC01_9EURY|nr:hypothetical protein [Salinirubellus salinus]UWM55204.1 hypothetical protein N0B31_02720 [Salinirubellus salinus]
MTDNELPCRIDTCGFEGSSPASLRSHVTGKTDEDHREAAEDQAWTEWYPEAFGLDEPPEPPTEGGSDPTDEGSEGGGSTPEEGDDEYAAQYEPPTEGGESGDGDGDGDPHDDPAGGGSDGGSDEGSSGSSGGWSDLLWIVVPLGALVALLAGGSNRGSSEGGGGESTPTPEPSESGDVTDDDTATASTGVPTFE